MANKTTDERVGITETEIDNLQKSDNRQWEILEKLQNRLPVWATVVISLLTFLLGSITGALIYSIRMAA